MLINEAWSKRGGASWLSPKTYDTNCRGKKKEVTVFLKGMLLPIQGTLTPQPVGRKEKIDSTKIPS